MVIDLLQEADRYAGLHPLFPAAFEFLRHPELAALAAGRHPVDGDALFAIVSKGPARERSAARLETHRKFIDIQLVIAGSDEMGWRALSGCRLAAGDYDAERDVRFFDDQPVSWVATPASAFCIFFPEDAHAPLVGTGTIHKVVVKVAV